MVAGKISIIGAGEVGRNIAFLVVIKNLAQELVLADIQKDLAKGLSLDLEDSRFPFSSNTKVSAVDNLKYTKSSDIVVISAGRPRTPGMSREDLIKFNSEVVKDIASALKKYTPDSIIIVVTNPVDLMTYLVLKITGFSYKKVMGMGVSLDSARLANIITKKLSINISNLNPLVLGAHGKNMLISELSSLYGFKLSNFLSKKELEEVKKTTINRGAEIVGFLKKGSARFAPAVAVFKLLEAIVLDKKELSLCSVYLKGEFSLKDVCLGVPVILGKEGIKKILEMPLPKKEITFLKKAQREFKKKKSLLILK